MAVAFAEWCKLAGYKTVLGRIIAFVCLPFILLAMFALLHYVGFVKMATLENSKYLVAYAVLIFWILASIGIALYPKGKFLYQSKILNLVIGLFILVPTWASVVALFKADPTLLVYPIALVCLADTSAYFVGRKWGKHKLAPLISPGKSWEGVIGAMVSSGVVAGVGIFLFNIKSSFLLWILLNIITVLFSIVGDLFESLYKRQHNLKDSGVILPGHGGILDRIDSLTAALPIFTIGLMLFL